MLHLFYIDLEWFLSRLHVVETELEDPPITSKQGRFFVKIEQDPLPTDST